MTKLPEIIGQARNTTMPLEAWNCLITGEILDNILHHTNQYILIIQPNFSRERDANLTDKTELKACIGLLYLAASLRNNKQSLEELWGTDGDGVEKFRLVMNQRRFKFLTTCIRFDDGTTSDERIKARSPCPYKRYFYCICGQLQEVLLSWRKCDYR